jgi:hypothetical protein
MNRRGFLAALATFPVAAVGAAKAMAGAGNSPTSARLISPPNFSEVATLQIADGEADLNPIAARFIKGRPSYEDNLRKLVGDEIVSVEKLIFRHRGQGRSFLAPGGHILAYDGYSALTFDRDYATAAELALAVSTPGRYATCRAEGLWRPFGPRLPVFGYWSDIKS